MKTSLFIAAAAAAALPAAAVAQPIGQTRTVSVSYDDLDLGTEAGRKTLHSRIDGAVDRVCGYRSSSSLMEMTIYRNCRRQATGDSLAQARQVIARATSRDAGTVLAGR